MWTGKALLPSPLRSEGFPLAGRLRWSDSRDGLGAKGALGFALPPWEKGVGAARGPGRGAGGRDEKGLGVGDLLSPCLFCPVTWEQKKEPPWERAGAQPLSQILGAEARGVPTHLLSQPTGSGGEELELAAPFSSLLCDTITFKEDKLLNE